MNGLQTLKLVMVIYQSNKNYIPYLAHFFFLLNRCAHAAAKQTVIKCWDLILNRLGHLHYFEGPGGSMS